METAIQLEPATVHARRLKLALPAAALVLAGCGANSSAESSPAASPRPSEQTLPAGQPVIGYDVSVSQGTRNLPTDKDFAIVGVNETNARGSNPYFHKQLAWAHSLPDPGNNTAIYVLTGNPGSVVDSEKVTGWPNSGHNQYGNCDGSNSAACSYEYGRKRAQADLDYAGSDAPEMVWLNVEAGNFSWLNPPENKAALEGMTEQFQQAGKTVGVYSNTETWQQLVGGIPDKASNLFGLSEWVLGAHNLNEAKQNCRLVSFTGGKIVVAQMAGDDYPIDQDYVCE
jgi:hypothetical protein